MGRTQCHFLVVYAALGAHALGDLEQFILHLHSESGVHHKGHFLHGLTGHGGQVLHKALYNGLASDGQQGFGSGVGVRAHALAHTRHGDDDLHSKWFSLSGSRYARSRPLLVQLREGPHFPRK